MSRAPLPDGTYLDVTGNDPTVGVDSQTGRTARWDASASRLVDTAGNVVREVRQSHHKANAESRKASSGKTWSTLARFATLNAFVDEVARYLDDTERATWHVLYRHADAATSTAEVSITTVAEKVGRSTRSVMRAIDQLTAYGLIERLHRGRKQTGPSRYRIGTRPTDRLERIRQQADARAATKTPRRQRDTGVTLNGASRDEHGRFST